MQSSTNGDSNLFKILVQPHFVITLLSTGELMLIVTQNETNHYNKAENITSVIRRW